MKNPINDIQFNADGLVPVIAIDSKTGQLLMQAWANRDAVQATIDEGHAVYWSRSRGKLWRKGESSGHVQKITALYLDCDGDSLCYEVEQIGGIACHTGRQSCYYRKLEGQQWQDVLPVLKPSCEIYGKQ